jgi:Ala-tRNA(Pro) deacylase
MLEQRRVPFEEVDHFHAVTANEVTQREHDKGHRFAKVVVVIADHRPVELVLPANRYVDLERVRVVLNAKQVRPATDDEMERFFPNCEVGAIPALRHSTGLKVIMDRSLRVRGDILFQVGTATKAIRLRFLDWFEMVEPQMATIAMIVRT